MELMQLRENKKLTIFETINIWTRYQLSIFNEDEICFINKVYAFVLNLSRNLMVYLPRPSNKVIDIFMDIQDDIQDDYGFMDPKKIYLFKLAFKNILKIDEFINEISVMNLRSEQQVIINVLKDFINTITFDNYCEVIEVKSIIRKYKRDAIKGRKLLKKYVGKNKRNENKRFKSI